jgi:hypothetical protein
MSAWRADDRRCCADGDHRGTSRVDGLDDFGVVDPLQVDGGDAEVAVAELALNDDQRDAFARHLHRVRVAQLMRGEASPHTGPRGDAAQFGTCTAGSPWASAGAPVDDAEQRTDGQGDAGVEPRLELLPAPSRPCRPRGVVRPCRDGPAASRGGGPDRAHRARALRRCEARRATARPLGRAVADRAVGRRGRASPRRSLRRWAGQPGSAGPYCVEDGRREIRAWSPASGADRQHRALGSPPPPRQGVRVRARSESASHRSQALRDRSFRQGATAKRTVVRMPGAPQSHG